MSPDPDRRRQRTAIHQLTKLRCWHIPLYVWRYRRDQAPDNDHGGPHIGPMAEDFQSLTTLGRPDYIDVVDYLGVLTSALQRALERIGELESYFEGEAEAGRPEQQRVN